MGAEDSAVGEEQAMRGEPERVAGEPGRGQQIDRSVRPADLKVKISEQRLIVDWQDGVRSEFDLAHLRRVCPCATCRTEREAQGNNPLKILRSDPAGVRVTGAELVGNYAIQFRWSDGHDTGIFDFRFLRRLGGE